MEDYFNNATSEAIRELNKLTGISIKELYSSVNHNTNITVGASQYEVIGLKWIKTRSEEAHKLLIQAREVINNN